MTEDIQYYHGRLEKYHWREFTLACVVPNILDFTESIGYTLVSNEIYYGIRVGITLLHPKDHYCKKTGREKSFGNIKYTKFKLDSIEFLEDRIIYYFRSDNISLEFESKPTRNKLYLIKADYAGGI